MSTRTRRSPIGTVTTLIVVALIFGTLFKVWKPPSKGPGTKEEPSVQFTAIWDPSPRKGGTLIQITVGGVVLFDGMETVAPFGRTFFAKRGQYVEIRSSLRGAGNAFLGCSIAINGLEVVNEHYKAAKPEERLTCQATA